MTASRVATPGGSHLAVIARPTGHVLLRLDVVGSAQRHHAGLRHDSAHDFTFHGDKGVPVTRDLLIRSQLKLAGEGMGMIHCCVGRKQKAACEKAVAQLSGTVLGRAALRNLITTLK